MTIRVRLAIAYAATLAVSLFLVGAIVWWQQGAAAWATLDARLVSELDDLERVVAAEGPRPSWRPVTSPMSCSWRCSIGPGDWSARCPVHLPT